MGQYLRTRTGRQDNHKARQEKELGANCPYYKCYVQKRQVDIFPRLGQENKIRTVFVRETIKIMNIVEKMYAPEGSMRIHIPILTHSGCDAYLGGAANKVVSTLFFR